MDQIVAFPTIIYQARLTGVEEMNHQLREDILAFEADLDDKKPARQPASKRWSNVGRAWHSSSDFFTWETQATRELQGLIRDSVREMMAIHFHGKTIEFEVSLEGWANVLRRGGYNRLHVHPNCNWSGTYYVDVGKAEREGSGRIEFLDPRNRPDMRKTGSETDEWVTIEPTNGKIVMFPSWLYHTVNPYEGEGERISVSFNVSLVRLTETPA